MPDRARALVVIDYQNIHLTAHDVYAPDGLAKHLTLVHPLYFATQTIHHRNKQLEADDSVANPPADLAAVAVFRGLPSNKHDPKPYQYSQAQKSEWTRDRRVKVNYRPLRYRWDSSAGKQVKTEKGVDVLVALAAVDAARESEFDVVILATHDTDLEPAVEVGLKLARQSGSWFETVGWSGCKILKPNGPRQWHTTLGGSAFVNSRDRKQY